MGTIDLYVFDIGGMCCMPGIGHEMVASHFNELIRQIQDRPSTLFLMWSSFTGAFFWEQVKEEYPDLVLENNVVFRYNKRNRVAIEEAEGWKEKVKKWLSL